MDKCLEFTLPTGSAGMAAGMTKMAILKKINKLKLPFKTKTKGYRLKVWFDNESDYTYFFLVWETTNPWHQPRLIEEDYTPPESPWTQDKS